MADVQNGRASGRIHRENLGLLALGAAGRWEVALDETLSGAERHYLYLEGPSISCHCEIASTALVGAMIRFLEPNLAPSNETSLVLGKDTLAPIALVKDDEYADRYFVVVGPPERPIVQWTIAGTEVAQLADALRQAQEDLDDAS